MGEQKPGDREREHARRNEQQVQDVERQRRESATKATAERKKLESE
jgi:hypothetical protein